MTRLYLDVDGVLLHHPPGDDGPIMGQVLKEGVPEFLEWASQNFECLWLTGWAPLGRMRLLSDKLVPHLPECAKNFKIAHWCNLKTEGITDGDFYWIDDNLLADEKDILIAKGWMNRFILAKATDPSITAVMKALQAKHK